MLLCVFPHAGYLHSENVMSEAPLPHDAGDLARCMKLLVGVPEVRAVFLKSRQRAALSGSFFLIGRTRLIDCLKRVTGLLCNNFLMSVRWSEKGTRK